MVGVQVLQPQPIGVCPGSGHTVDEEPGDVPEPVNSHPFPSVRERLLILNRKPKSCVLRGERALPTKVGG